MAENSVAQILDEIGVAFEDYKRKSESRIETLEQKLAIHNVTGGAHFNTGTRLDTPKGEVTLLSKGQRISTPGMGSADFSLGDYVRSAVVGSTKAMGTGPALVPTGVSNQIIDLIRAATVINEAGATTIVINEPTNFARITSDPTVYQHTENADDIVESDIGLEPIAANPKLLAAIIPVSEELVSDSPNLDAVLNASVSAAFAAKLDALVMAKLLSDAGMPKSAAGQDPAIWAKVLEAVGSAMALDQALPLALISNPADFIARAAQTASTAGSWLGKPPALSGMLELATTTMTATKAVMGDFSKGVLIAMRSQLRIEVVRWAKSTKAQHALVCHMRADGYVAQPNALYRMTKTV